MTVTFNVPLKQYAWIAVIFFFVNVFLMYRTAPGESMKLVDEVLPNSFDECTIVDELALSALRRVKSPKCKQKIHDITCKISRNNLHVDFPASTCPNHDPELVNSRIGCFSDDSKNRVLKEFKYDLNERNSRKSCRDHCYKAGYVFYGLEYEKECFCGNDLSNATTVADSECHKYKCQTTAEYCGGFNAIEVFHTGHKESRKLPVPKYVPADGDLNNPVKILFLLQLNGRNDRQVKRFFKAIYSPHNYYLVHVDKRQEYMLAEMQKIANKYPNFFISSKRFSTIWGGASLLQMFHEMIRESIKNSKMNDWEYIINFSESDFPILPMKDFYALLNENRGYSFLASHGYNTGRFIQKQGFEYVFTECEERMWRVGKRVFPSELRIDGGSDWVVVHRQLAEYSISEEKTPTMLRDFFSTVLLPLESFYHTISHHSIFCDKVKSGNLRLTNWYRKQGCRCAGLKKVVDWCGCSPLVFRNDTIAKFELKKAVAKPVYFSRKFDSMLFIEAIEEAEKQSVPKELIQDTHPTYHSAWSNVYERSVDGESEKYLAFAKSIASIKGESLQKLSRVDAYRKNSQSRIQIVLSTQTENGHAEFLVEQQPHVEIISTADVAGFSLEEMITGSRFEYKEEVCREYTGIFTETSTVQLKMVWTAKKSLAENNEKTSPEVEVYWRDANYSLIVAHNVKEYNSVWGGQFDEVDLTNRTIDTKTCRPFTATVKSKQNRQTIGVIEFPILPLDNPSCHKKLTNQFYKILDWCQECSQTPWSTSHPDPKSDITELNPF